jgi:DNA-binding transcriptional LysR family regulator
MKPLLQNLRIADLELFITAARLKSLGQAALLHHLSQSAASTAIQRVETAFGQILCTHERRQFCLTHEGKNLLPRAESWLKSLKESVSVNIAQPIRLATTHAIARVAISAILPITAIDLKLMRPDSAHRAILRDEADLALVLDNAPWKEVSAAEIGKGKSQLFSTQKEAVLAPVLLPEDQMEVLSLQERWSHLHSSPIPIKARLPSWSLIADICRASQEIGFLPDFLAQTAPLYPVSWQPPPSSYRILALYRKSPDPFQQRIQDLVGHLRSIFAS